MGRKPKSIVQKDQNSGNAVIDYAHAWNKLAEIVGLQICDLRSAESLALPLRPCLQSIYESMCLLLSSIVLQKLPNTSMMLIGAAGSGKSLVIQHVMHTLSSQHNKEGDRQVGFVLLNATLHLDERAALAEVARQLCEQWDLKYSKAASFDENLVFLREVLSQLRKSMKTVVFVIDGFDKYCKRGKQVLLYNLLDSLQSSSVQAAVIGLTRCIDVKEQMEKRVLSRFSHHRVAIPPLANIDEVLALSRGLLSIPGKDDGSDSDPAVRVHNQAVDSVLQSQAVKDALSKLWSHDNTPRLLTRAAASAVQHWRVALSQGGESFSALHLIAGAKDVWRTVEGSLASVVSGLSVLELLLLVAAYRLVDKGSGVRGRLFNYEMVYSESRAFQQGREHLDFTWKASFAAFQLLVSQGLAQYVDARAEQRGMQLRYAGARLQVTRDELMAGIQEHPCCPDLLKRYMLQEV